MSQLVRRVAARVLDDGLAGWVIRPIQHDVAGSPFVATVHDSLLRELDPVTVYEILRLRSEIFVVEQECAYLDPDGRDLEPDARQLWITQDDAVVATLRLLHDDDGAVRIGRVATAPSARGAGLAAQLMTRALELAGDGRGRAGRADLPGRLVHAIRLRARRRRLPRGRHPARPDAAPNTVRTVTTHSTSPFPDEDDREKAWAAAVAEQRGGAAYADLIAAQRLLQDRVAGAVLPSELVHEVTARLTELSDAARASTRRRNRNAGTAGVPTSPAGHAAAAAVRRRRARRGPAAPDGSRSAASTSAAAAAAHGGSHTLLFDDLMGHVAGMVGGISRTAYLTINYRRITPIDVELHFDVRLDRVDGRKRFISARLYNPDGEVVADCTGLFLRLRPGQQ